MSNVLSTVSRPISHSASNNGRSAFAHAASKVELMFAVASLRDESERRIVVKIAERIEQSDNAQRQWTAEYHNDSDKWAKLSNSEQRIVTTTLDSMRAQRAAWGYTLCDALDVDAATICPSDHQKLATYALALHRA